MAEIDIVAAAQAHLASLPPHLKDRYSANLIAKLVAELTVQRAASPRGDIVTRLRKWTISTNATPASDLMDEAADEIERLRAKPVTEPLPEAPAGRGNVTPEPAAWAVASIANNQLRTFHRTREEAESQIAEVVRQGVIRYADTMRVVPLYFSPTLTEAAHDALEFAVETGRVAIHDEATLRNLLERLK